jgi:hypothetical protein
LGCLLGSRDEEAIMIISASYKTDIPAFYGKWFLNRLNAGYCRAINPYSRQFYQVSLKRDYVDGFVFWTKNLGPFIDTLDIVYQRSNPFIVQYTIHAYTRELESFVVDTDRSVEHMKLITNRYGKKVAIWRYDPIIVTSITPIKFHLKNFRILAQRLEGTTDEVVISFAQIYKKTLRSIDNASKKFGFTWEDPNEDIKFNLAAQLAKIAKAYGMQLTMCSQRRFVAPGIKEARCIDARRLSNIAGYPIHSRLKGNRAECGCYESIDIGAYDTCPHGCIYCYAVQNNKLAKENFKAHDPTGEFICEPGPCLGMNEMGVPNTTNSRQKTLTDLM